MRILIVNPPHWAIGSRLAGEHLPPLGLLCIAGPLIDAGYNVQLLDADYDNLCIDKIVSEIILQNPDFLLLGHSGSTSAQPVINEITKFVRQKNSTIKIIIGGVFPTFHWGEILCNNPQIDYIVCGEGEATCLNLITVLEHQQSPDNVRGIAYRLNGNPVKTASAELITDLDNYRIAWELMDNYRYTYWGQRKAAVVQFSRGCPYPCVYCGQSLFWQKWRHRNPQKFADELEMLHKKYGVEVFNFADENMSSHPDVWKEFLEVLITKNLPLILVGSIRTDNIVRDADILHLYKKAGFERFLLGIENYDESVIRKINKAGTVTKDREAIQLLRKHGILSMATYVIGFGDETIGDFYRSLKQLLLYDPDQIQLLFVTPHRWTPLFDEIKHKEIILTDQRKWDYKHQVLANKHLPAWLIFLCSKLIEVTMQARPKALYRLLFQKDVRLRNAMKWYTRIGKRVWFAEWYQFFFTTKLTKEKVTLADFWAEPKPQTETLTIIVENETTK
ncbi:MAG: magnesium-protoporphyrin IX monomethyl ester anaerobic oxidative cyclase [Planctomycetaceae bacterium]|jgi:anaerobic magnesium-protoporphyrin IX monomethyl ester cyclase|nr:magnesium-protoporphyrin IX monomethyl ester anaerobic oxidative cyclase [Planctomycetaceae bacterium]